MVESDLTAALVGHLEGVPAAAQKELARAVAALCEGGRRAWPGISVAPADFVRHVAARLPPDAEDLVRLLGQIHAEDLYLACACTLGSPKAYAAFEERFMPAVSTYVAKIDRSPAFADEIRQVLRTKLFVAAGDGQPKIADYSGRGPLAGWLRVASIRAAQNLTRYAKPHRALDDVPLALQDGRPDPELDYLRSRYAGELAEAFRNALSALSARERTVLSLHFCDGLSATAIASLEGVHEATIRRWLEKIRRAVLEETRQALRRRLGASSSEVDSLVDLLQSRLDGTIRGWLRAPAGAAPDRS